jgi:tetratricopeptide (TPR) repeat protein
VFKLRSDYPRARRALGEATDIFEELGDRSGAAWSINQQGDIVRATGDMAAARGLYQRALSEFRAAGDPWGSARSLTDLGSIDCERGDHLSGHAAYREALEIFAVLGHRRGVARTLEAYAGLALAEGHAARALTLAAAAAHLRRLIGAPLPQAEQSRLDRMLLPAWKSLNEPEGKGAWAEGSAMSLEKAISYTLGEQGSVTSG